MKRFLQKNLKALFFYLFFVLVGIGYGYIMIDKLPDLGPVGWLVRYFEGLVIFCLAVIFQIALHEAGHLLAGLLRGWKFISFMMFGILLSHKDGHFRLSRFNIAGAGGQCLMLPPEQGDTRNGILFYNAGGFLMNLLVALVAVAVLGLCWSVLNYETAALMQSLSLSGLLFAALNGIPAIAGGIPNDGYNMKALKDDAYACHIFTDSLRTIGLMQQGKGLQHLHPVYYTDGHELDYANPIHAMALNHDLSLALARHDWTKGYEIAGLFKQHTTDIISFYVREIRMELLYLSLVHPHPQWVPQQLMTNSLQQYIQSQLSFRPTPLRTLYAWTRLQLHDEAAAARLYAQFEQVCHSYYIPGEVQTEQQLIDLARQLPLPVASPAQD